MTVATAPTFLPPDIKDFKATAKALAAIFSLRLSCTQAMLARIYGFADLEEVGAALGAREADRPPLEPCAAMDRMAALDRRMVPIVREALGARLQGIEHDLSDEAILFGTAERRKAGLETLRVKTSVKERRGSPEAGRSLTDYATVRSGRYGTYLAFTALGAGLYAACEGDDSTGDEETSATVDFVAGAHPLFAWAQRAKVSREIQAAGLYGWVDLDLNVMPGRGQHPETFDEHPFQKMLDGAAAKRLAEGARAVTDLFERYYGATKEFADPKDRTPGPAPHGCETSEYLYALGDLARAALAAGDAQAAHEAAAKALTVDGRDGTGARYLLAVAALNLGRRPAAFPDDTGAAAILSGLCAAFKSAPRPARTEAAWRYLAHSPMAIRAFDPTMRGADRIRVGSSEETLARLRQVIHQLAPFFRSNPETAARVDALCRDPEVRRTFTAYHEAVNRAEFPGSARKTAAPPLTHAVEDHFARDARR